MNHLLLFSVCAFYLCSQASGKDSVKLTVLYQPYCGGCQHFIADQLFPNWGTFNASLSLDLIINLDDDLLHWLLRHPEFFVAHFQHMCAIYEACGYEGSLGCSVPKLSRALQFISCTMKTGDPSKSGMKCALEAKLDPMFPECGSPEVALHLASHYIDKTAYISDVYKKFYKTEPFLVFNDKFNKTEFDTAHVNLRSVICKYIPQRCQ